MILTGKALKDFENWLRETHYKYYLSAYGVNPDTCNYALIIEWLDSIGVYIEVGVWHREKNIMYFGWDISDFEGYLRISHDRLKVNNRQEATRQAIIKAREIYNSKF